ncbi:MAG TPA: 4'-phosphopantetheinyl transferase superfamily protein [Pyrinomonadaceae bacterium]|jgi:4'-phosphopantetheinyl transferase
MNSNASLWYPAPERFTLDGDEVHVWNAALDQSPTVVGTLFSTLTPDEQDRAAKYYFRKDCDRYIVARGVLRTIISAYLNTKPEQLRFRYSSFGKPALISDSGSEELRFNVAHSGGRALYAFSRKHELGIDIERLREDFDYLEIAEHYFSQHEISVLRALPREAQAQGFFNCWTRKEAYLKAHGAGLSFPLDSFDVSLVPGERARLLSVKDDSQAAARWSLQEINVDCGYVAALAVEGADWRLKCWQWQPQALTELRRS